MINIVSSIYNLKFVQIVNPILVNKPSYFQITFGSLGEPSCASITLKWGSKSLLNLTIGSSQLYCMNLYPNENYMGIYNVSVMNNVNVLTFQLTLPQTGNFILNANFSNSVSISNMLNMGLNIAQMPVNCGNPLLDIKNRASVFYNPIVFKRNDMFSIVSIIDINCNMSLKNIKQWSVFRMNETTGTPISMLNINQYEYPELFLTMYYADLVVRPNNLGYGLYKFVLTVTILDTNNMFFSSQIDTFIRIVPSGLIISALSSSIMTGGGTIIITRGFTQEIDFNPILNSYDLDSLATIVNLNFKYYCQIIDAGIERGYPEIYLNRKIDLYKTMLEPDLPSSTTSNKTCFKTQGK
jgi:hypothetical protein